MFQKSDPVAVVLRILVFLLNFTSMPILAHFVRGGLIKVIFGEQAEDEEGEEELFVQDDDEERRCKCKFSAAWFNLLTAVVLAVPLVFTIFYPNIGTILSIVGACCGFLSVYYFPTICYL